MAVKIKKIETLEVHLDTKPGELANIYGAFKEEGINIVATWGYEMGPGEGRCIVYPANLDKCQKVLKELGLKAVKGNACYAEGDDAVGVYSDLLQKIKKAEVNLHASDAFGVGGKFAAVFFAEDQKGLCKALGCS